MLSRLAVQICAVQALMGNTVAGQNVRDSATGVIRIDADGDIKTGEQQPFINVFSEETEQESPRLELMGPSRTTQVFQFGVTGAMPLVTAEGRYLIDEESGGILMAERQKPSDAQINIILEMIERQIRVALTDPGNPWAVLWGRFLTGPFAFTSIRGQSREESVRFGARQFAVTGTVIGEPPYGGVIRQTSVWRTFLDLLAGSDLADLAQDIERLLGTDAPGSDLEYLRRRYGHSKDAARALGYGFGPDQDPETPIRSLVVSDIDQGPDEPPA